MRKNLLILSVLVALHLFFLTQLRFTAWPEMLSFPYLRNHSYLLYKDMVHAYPPLLTMFLSVMYKIFGYHLWVLQVITWGLLITNDILVFFIAKKFSKSTKGALISVIFYVALQPFLEGNQLWFDLAITTPLLIGFLLILHQKHLLAAFFLCIAAFTKQTGGLFFIAYLAWLIFSKTKPRITLKVLLVPLLFVVPLGIRLLQEGAIQGFLNWVIIYPSSYWTKFPGYIDLQLDRRELVILLLIVLPAFVLLLKKKAWLLLIFCAVGLASVYPRFSFFHLQTALPFFAIAYSLLNKMEKKKMMVIIVAFLIIALQYIYQPVLAYEWQKPPRFWPNEEKSVAAQIPSNETVYLLGYHSGHYVLANSLPPKPWIDSYPWVFEIPGLQEQTLKAWNTNPPKYIFWQPPSEGNWYDIGTYQPKLVTQWIKDNYTDQGKNIWQKKD